MFKVSWLFILCFTILLPFQAFSLEDRSMRVSLSDETFKLGETMRVDLFAHEPIPKSSVVFMGKTIRLMPVTTYINGSYQYAAYVGVSRRAKLGRFPVKVYARKMDNTLRFRTFQVTITGAKFQRSNVRLTGAKRKLGSRRRQLAEESRLLSTKFKTTSSVRRFSRPFIKPASGRFTTRFGAVRSYNGKASGNHSGVDIANRIGSPVLASNDGRVIFSRDLRSHGKTILLDHGFGVVTVYNHLNDRVVQEGDEVKRGQLIGKIGMTGISTGPHLHWGMSVNNVRVDPLFWLYQPRLYD